MNRPPRQVAEPLPGRLDTSVGCQLKRNRLQYLQQDGVHGGLFLGNGHVDTVRTPANRAAPGGRRCRRRLLRRIPHRDGVGLTGQFTLAPAVKAPTAVLLAGAALTHPVARERRWLIAALLFSAAGDVLLAMPWWAASFVLDSESLAVPIRCAYAASLVLVTAGFFFGRASVPSATPSV